MRLRVRGHNTLLDLVQEKRVGRESWAGQFLYVSVDAARAAAQLALRRTQPESASGVAVEVPASAVIEVLLDLVQGADPILAPRLLRSAPRTVSSFVRRR